jgi:hypothetical protein
MLVDLTAPEVESALFDENTTFDLSDSSGRPIAFGSTDTGRYIAVVFEVVNLSGCEMCPEAGWRTIGLYEYLIAIAICCIFLSAFKVWTSAEQPSGHEPILSAVISADGLWIVNRLRRTARRSAQRG